MFRNGGDGFTFDLPVSWKSPAAGRLMDPSALFSMASPGSMFGMNKPIDPKKIEPLMRLVDTGTKVMPTDAPVMVKVEEETLPEGTNLKDESDKFEAAVYDVVKAKRTEVSTPAGPATMFVATRKLVTGDLFHFVDCVLVDKAKVIRFRFCGNEPSSIKKVADDCMKTFRMDPQAKVTFQTEQAEPLLGTGLGANLGQ